MMNESNVIDVSGFFLFEATGDSSEIQSSVLDEDSAAADHHQWSDDDAQSCSGRVFGEVDDAGCDDEIKRVSSCLSFEENYEYDDDICDAAGGGGNETDEDDDDEEEEVNQRWIMSVKRGKKLMRQQSKIWPLGVVRTTTRIKPKKSKVCNLEMTSEKDRDRLFWEACLSSS